MESFNSESDRYAELSRQYIQRAGEYLRAGDRVQASEKGWGAVAEAIKSIAEQRGWNHQGHRLLNDVAFQLCEEWNRPDVRILFDAMEKLHINFYEDNMGLDAIAASVSDAKALLRELESLRTLSPRPVALDSRERRLRWRRLTGELLPLGAETNEQDNENSRGAGLIPPLFLSGCAFLTKAGCCRASWEAGCRSWFAASPGRG